MIRAPDTLCTLSVGLPTVLSSKDLRGLKKSLLLCLSPVLPALTPKGSVQVAAAGDLQCFVAKPTLQTEREKGKDKHTHCKENMTSANLNPDALNSVKAGASRPKVMKHP